MTTLDASLKHAVLPGVKRRAAVCEARLAVFEWIVRNTRRKHSRLNRLGHSNTNGGQINVLIAA
ncbi:hypothetical protein ABZ297_07480 [Nonomuraea sp. NPDC005983]|uniref:hypothetical protein n=1 Tax=Nonomuraea sp. NPDC005983 TaxID=3155595 RepID=UPI0033B84EC5